MSETKHTPGPWRYQAEVTLEPGRLPRKVFEVYNVGGAFGHPASCDREADARLIAAAPELLARLKSLEWAATIDGYPACPACAVAEGEEHKADCGLMLLIAKAEPMREGD